MRNISREIGRFYRARNQATQEGRKKNEVERYRRVVEAHAVD